MAAAPKKTPKQIAAFVSAEGTLPTKTKGPIPGLPSSRHHSLMVSSIKRPASENTITANIPQENAPRPSSVLQESIKNGFQAKFVEVIEEALVSTITRSDVPAAVAGVRELARAHQWREVCSLSEDLLNCKNALEPTGPTSTTLLPHERVELSLAYVFACRKLRKFKSAADHLATLGDLSGPRYSYEFYPETYPNKSGSFVPFSLLVLHALMPRYVGHLDKALEQLYALLNSVQQEAMPTSDELPLDDEPVLDVVATVDTIIDPLLNNKPEAKPVKRVRLGPRQERLHRERMVVFVLVDIHISIKQFTVVVALMRKLIAQDPNNTTLLQQLSRMCIQIGQTPLGLGLLARSNELIKAQGRPGITPDEHMNRGFGFVAHSQYTQALLEFEAVCALDPTNVHAANNRSICLLHLGRLAEATASLEDMIVQSPHLVAHECVVQNLCALYDLQDDNVLVKKQVLVDLIKAVAPDSFDFSSIRLPQA